MYNVSTLSDMMISELREIADSLNISGAEALNKNELITKITAQQDCCKA